MLDVVGAGPLKVVLDLDPLGVSGYQAADWLREHRRVTVGLSDHRRIVAQFNHSDDEETMSAVVDALDALVRPRRRFRRRRRSRSRRPTNSKPILDCLRSGLEAGMELPDPADSGLKSVRVVAKRC